MRRLEGVERIQIDLQRNLVTIKPEARQTVNLAAFPAAIRRAGFQPEDMKILAKGTIERIRDETRFRIDGWPFSFQLENANPNLEGPTVIEAQVHTHEESPHLVVLGGNPGT